MENDVGSPLGDFIARRKDFGLRVDEEYLWRFILLINDGNQDEWLIDGEGKNFFTMAIIIVEGIGWANWKSVFRDTSGPLGCYGKLTRDMLIPFDGGHVLIFPWEVVEKEQRENNKELPVLLPWNRQQDVYLDSDDDANKINRELELILRYIHRGEIGTIAPDICLEGLSEAQIMNVALKQNKWKRDVPFMDPTELDTVSFFEATQHYTGTGPRCGFATRCSCCPLGTVSHYDTHLRRAACTPNLYGCGNVA